MYNVRDNPQNEHSELDLSCISTQVPMICNFLFHKKFKRKEDNELDIDSDVDVIFFEQIQRKPLFHIDEILF